MANVGVMLHGRGLLRVEEVPEPDGPKLGEVKLAMHSVGIGGSEIRYWKDGTIDDFVLRTPMLLGHESSGKVLEVGEGVKDLQVGDRVAVEPGIPCRECKYCLLERYNLCADIAFLATPPYHGNMVRRHVHDADFCYKLPDNVTYDEGALLEPLALGVHACRRAGVTTGQNVLVCGAGPVGLASFLAAKAFGRGTNRVVVVDVMKHRLKVARKCGADATYLVPPDATVSGFVESVEDSFGGEKPDVTIECSGSEVCLSVGVSVTKRGGCIALVGLNDTESHLPLQSLASREIDIRGVYRYPYCYPIAIGLVATGQIDAKPLITHRFPMEQAIDAFTAASNQNSKSIKVIVDCAGEDSKK